MKRVVAEVGLPKLDLVDLDPLLDRMRTTMMISSRPRELVPYVFRNYDSYKADR